MILLEVLYAILPVFAIMLFGVIINDKRWLPPETSQVMSVYVLRIALPMLLLHALAGAHLEDLLHGGFWLGTGIALFLPYVMGYFGDLFLARRGHGPAVVTAMSCSCCNAAFLGIPIVAFLVPHNQEAMVIAGLTTLSTTLIMVVGQCHLDILQQRAAQGGGSSLWPVLRQSVLFNPLVFCSLLGLFLGVLGTGLWTPLDRAATIIGASSAPCLLLVLGMDLRRNFAVAMQKKGGHKVLRQTVILVIKLIVHPAATWLMLYLCGMRGMWLAIGVIMASTATALGAYVVAFVYRSVPEESALSVVLSNGLCLVTMTCFAYAFKVMEII